MISWFSLTFWKSFVSICIPFSSVPDRNCANFNLSWLQKSIMRDKNLPLYCTSFTHSLHNKMIYSIDSHFVLEYVRFYSATLWQQSIVGSSKWGLCLMWTIKRPSAARCPRSTFVVVRNNMKFCNEYLFNTATLCLLIFVCCKISDHIPCLIKNDQHELPNIFPAPPSFKTGNLALTHP
jgi:hypothetical protein